VDDTACLKLAASEIIMGAGFDNNLLCIGEKEIFVLDTVADKFMAEMENSGAVRLNASQLEALTAAAFTIVPGCGGGCAKPVLNRELLGKDPDVLARAAGITVSGNTPLLFAETDANHAFVTEEQMMPFIPVVRVGSVEEGIKAAKSAERGCRHSGSMFSNNVQNITLMGRELDSTLFAVNGSSMTGLGLGGEGFVTFSVATATGEGFTNPKTYTRTRRIALVNMLKMY
jgi:aldehyde dehydrogenase